MSEQVTVHVEAPVDRVWALVSDVTLMGEWSPEVYEAQWVDGATGPVVGARFKARNRRFGFVKYANTSIVVAAVPVAQTRARGQGDDGITKLTDAKDEEALGGVLKL